MRRRLLATLSWAAVGLACTLLAVVAVLGASLLGPQFPSEEDLPSLPDGYAMGEVERSCGSGGCFLEAEVTPPEGTDEADAFRELDAAVSDCGARSLLDRRSQCTGAELRGDGSIVVSVMLRDLGK